LVRRMYVDEQMSAYEIAWRTGWTYDTVYRRMKKYGIQTRSKLDAIQVNAKRNRK
jgi:hypothetical protein